MTEAGPPSAGSVANGQAIDWTTAGEKVVPVDVFDGDNQKVFTAEITMNVKMAEWATNTG